MHIEDKLNEIENIIKEPSFLEKKGLSNEVGYYIFDYNPKYEMEVRVEVKHIEDKINSNENYGFKIVNFDLYEIIMDILKSQGFLDKTFEFEEKKGRNFAKNALISLLNLDSDDDLIVKYIVENTPNFSVVFLTGVGKSYPILRSHNILNNLHQRLDKVPVVLFFPGKYSGIDLILFNSLKASNYYQAFPLIPEGGI